MDQAEYTWKLLSRSYLKMRRIIANGDYLSQGFVVSILNWMAQTFDSDALLLAWPDPRGSMRVQESVTADTPELQRGKSVICFERLRKWLDGEHEQPLAIQDTTEIPTLQDAGIRSLCVTGVFMPESGFEAKDLLVVCNRVEPALEDQFYLGYDRQILCVGQWMITLHISDRYRLLRERYEHAREEHRRIASLGSLTVLRDTARDLLSLHREHSAPFSPRLLYDYLDAGVALFNGKAADPQELRAQLERSEEWLELVGADDEKEWAPIHCALARGYFVLGIENSEAWYKGVQVLCGVEQEGR